MPCVSPRGPWGLFYLILGYSVPFLLYYVAGPCSEAFRGYSCKKAMHEDSFVPLISPAIAGAMDTPILFIKKDQKGEKVFFLDQVT